MKLIVAYIRSDRLNPVKQALYDVEIHKISITNALGCGEEYDSSEEFRGVGIEVDLSRKVRLEIAVNQEEVEITVNAIIKGAKTGQEGDGKIFIVPLDNCIRIRNGEQGATVIA